MTLRNAFEGLATEAKQDAQIGRLPRNAEHFIAGRYRSAGGKQPVGSGATGCLQIANPSGSGAVVTITEFMLTCSQNADVTFVFDATVTNPTLITPFNPHRAYAAAPTLAVVRRGGSGYTGGTVLSPVYRLAADRSLDKPYTLVLMPGQSVLAAISVPTLGSADFYASSTWVEEAL